MKITYWSDYACPFCYIGETYLEQAITELGAEGRFEIEMKAFELDPNASKKVTGSTVDRFAKKYGLTVKAAADRIDSISKMGREVGLDFRYAETRYTNTFDAHRLTKFARSKGGNTLANRISERLYKAYFSESMELASHDVLVRIAVQEGLDEAEVKEFLLSDCFADEVRADEYEAALNGVHAVPFFVVGEEYTIHGALPVDRMKKLLKEVLEKEEKKAQTSDIAPMSCGPDGCHIGG